MSHLKVKFDWNKNAPGSSSSGLQTNALNLNLNQDKSASSSFLEKSSFGSGVISAFTSTVSGAGNNTATYCCLTEEGQRCQKIAGNASYSKRIQKIVQQKKLRLSIDGSARHVYICDYHKGMIQSVRGPVGDRSSGQAPGKRKRKDDHNEHDFMDEADMISGHHSGDLGFHSSFFDSDSYHHEGRKDPLAVDLASLQVNALRRYKKHFHVPAKPGLNKQQLAEVLHRHFRSIPVNEKEAITFFIYMVKCNKNKLDREAGSGGNQEASSSGKSSGNHLSHLSLS